ncbi:glycosyltransferase family 4 protein ['Paenibacillus yunnanensis' Narsing Rao et al. 2020]|uniref:glycosyltransferase family 4 protein n=1 Tax=Paenibacillus tengchongensis TaxID=2608684 RepID=UPI00124E2017|nr:glycosyltransferase family 1 protein [Paenibacillus tengchongensis]
MRLALFTDTYLPQTNGVSRTLKRLTGHLDRRGIEHILFTPKPGPEELCASPVRPVTSIPFLLYPECRLALPSLFSIQSEMKVFRPDLVHLATPFNLGLCGLHVARKLRLPHVASYHTHFDRYLDYYRLKRLVPLYWKYMNWFHQSCDAILAPSRETIDTLSARGFTGLRLWSRGIDCSLYSPEKRRADLRERYALTAPLVLLYVGRLAPEKDVGTLLSAIRLLPPSAEAGIHLLVVGDGPLLHELQAQAPDNVTFTGARHGEELAELYASADLFVFPSSTETFGNVVLEAMASGLPVIAAGGGAAPELVAPGVNGRLFAPQDPQALALAIMQAAADPDGRAAMGREGRRLALGRSWESVFDGLIADYADVIERKAAARAAGLPAGAHTA